MQNEIRCGECNKLLGKGIALDLSIKCPRCGTINHVRAQSPNKENRRIPHRDKNVVVSSKRCNGIALAAGAAGLELGVSLALPGYRTVCWVERDAYAAATLVARMDDAALDDAPVWSDLAAFDGTAWRGKVDIVTAGYPCQPFSQAGRRLGEKDPRHLWPHVRRVLAETGAPLLFAENVLGHVTLGLEAVWNDLQAMGFQVEAGIFSAAEVGASHIRKRLFLLAYADGFPIRELAGHLSGERQAAACGGGAPVGDPYRRQVLDASLYDGVVQGAGLFPPFADAIDAWEQWIAARPHLQPCVVGDDDGLACKMDRYRLAGNGVVPLAAGYALATLVAAAAAKPE